MKRLSLTTALFVAAMGGPARGQPASAGPPADPSGTTSDPSMSADVATASALIERAAHAYDDGQLDEALRMLTQAYELSPRPSIIYNQAQVLRAKNDCAAALVAYRRFVAATILDDPNRDRAVRRQNEMQACVQQRRASPDGASETPGPGSDPAARSGAARSPLAVAEKSAAPGALDSGPAPPPSHPATPVRLALDRPPPGRAQGLLIVPAAAPIPAPTSVPANERAGFRRVARGAGWALLGVGALSASAAAILAWKAASLHSEISGMFDRMVMPWSDQLRSIQDDGLRDARWARWCAAAAALGGGGGATLLILFRSLPPAGEAGHPPGASALVGWSGVFR